MASITIRNLDATEPVAIERGLCHAAGPAVVTT